MRQVLQLVLFLVVFPANAAEPVTLRVMSFNIHHGEGLDQRVDLERIAKVIIEARADVVGLQEVDRGCERTQRRDLPAELATLTEMRVHFEQNIPYQGGEYGNAVLSRFPIKRAKNAHYRMLRPGEQRGVLQLVLDVHGREVLFMNTHIDYRPDDAERIMNVGELRQIVAAAPALPVILVGDFNATPESRTISLVREFMTDAWAVGGGGSGFTFPVRAPAKRIDYIFLSPGAFETKNMNVIVTEASDHLPIVATLVLK